MQVGTGLCGVVGITGIIQEADAALRLSACLYPPAVVQLPTMSDGISDRDESTEFVTVISPLRCILERQRERRLTIPCGMLEPLAVRLGDDAQFGARVFLRTDIGIKDVGGADAYHVNLVVNLLRRSNQCAKRAEHSYEQLFITHRGIDLVDHLLLCRCLMGFPGNPKFPAHPLHLLFPLLPFLLLPPPFPLVQGNAEAPVLRYYR